MIDRLATEILLQIIEFLDPPREFASAHDHDRPPPLKSFSRCSRRLYALCYPYLFRAIRFRLNEQSALQSIQNLRSFVAASHLRPQRIALTFGDNWNEGKIGIELKKLLWELQVPSITLYQERGHKSVREKCAHWAYALEHVASLRVETMDEDGDLKMLLLRQCPAQHMDIHDGLFHLPILVATPERLRNRSLSPGIVQLKPSMFPNLSRLCYTATWPPLGRFVNLLAFVVRLPRLERFEVELMSGIDIAFKQRDIWYRPNADGMRYREVISEYCRLAGTVDTMEDLKALVVRDRRNPWSGYVDPPKSMVETIDGVYRKINPACDGKSVYL